MNKISVLIVDDNEHDRYLLKRHLKETKFEFSEIFEKEDGKDALEFFNTYDENRAKYKDAFPPLVVFLDINMPLIGGFEFLEAFSLLREQLEVKASLIVIFSSSDREEDKSKAFSFDFVKSYLTKGKFTSQTLDEELGKLLSLPA